MVVVEEAIAVAHKYFWYRGIVAGFFLGGKKRIPPTPSRQLRKKATAKTKGSAWSIEEEAADEPF